LLFRDLRQSLGASTLIVISHRLSTLSTFERVVVLLGGHVVEDGNPDSFISAQGAYSKLLASNAS
jgi:ABC-type multidrug transport system fused ATPase/permease subunit